ncbi:hypothetical protein [Comamonas sp. wu1-DMT]|uniref:hypothetical protein n=1 Tax=Comamonas sp. wu1-DMT TaxID=3126390 RepID=UPI0032E3EA95
MQDKNFIKLTDQDAALLEQGASMLEGLENDERNRGNCSTAEGAGCSAHAVRRLASALLAHEREIGQCLHQIQEPAAAEQAAWHAGLDEGRAQAAPAAVAMPDELIRAAKQALACMDGLQQHLGRAVCQVEADALRAALAATPAAAPDMVSVNKEDANNYCRILAALGMEEEGDPVAEVQRLLSTAAAPVVLPEPVATLHCNDECYVWARASEAGQRMRFEQPIALFTEQQLRALLATATGLPAQAVEMPDFDLRTSKGGRGFVAWYFANVLQRYDYENYITNKLAADFACDLAKALSSTLAAPQAQADARDAALAASEQDALRLVRQAVRDFHYALDNRKHGGVAAGAAMNAIEMALNMYWQQGQEADRRASLAAQGGE